MLVKGSGPTWESVGYQLHGELLLSALSIVCERTCGGVFVCVGTYTCCTAGVICCRVFGPSVCPRPHQCTTLPFTGDTESEHNADWPEKAQKEGTDCKDYVVGGGKVCAHIFLKENLLSGFILFWLLRWPVLCADCSGWALCLWMLAGAMCHVLCILRLVCFHYKHTVCLCGNRRAVRICLFRVFYSRQMQWFKIQSKYMSSALRFLPKIFETLMSVLCYSVLGRMLGRQQGLSG